MIVRVWCGVASEAKAGAYLQHVTERVFPALNRIPGHRGAEVLRRETKAGVEFMVMTYWESLEAVREFAGSEVETAVVEPEARPLLAEFDPFVRHYELAHDAHPQ